MFAIVLQQASSQLNGVAPPAHSTLTRAASQPFCRTATPFSWHAAFLLGQETQGGFKNLQNRSRRRQSAHFSSITEISADCRRRLRFLETTLQETRLRGRALDNHPAFGMMGSNDLTDLRENFNY